MNLRKYSLYFVWVIASIGVLGSLYFSEIQHLEPCSLCWYQRIAIYPLAIIMGIAAFQGFYKIVPYVMPLAVLGIVFASYQVAIQQLPSLQFVELCGTGPSCAQSADIGLGPITLPMLSLFSLCLMTFLLAIAWPAKDKSS